MSAEDLWTQPQAKSALSRQCHLTRHNSSPPLHVNDRQARGVVRVMQGSDIRASHAWLSASSAKHMDAIPYVDSLIKEYLLFRGFTGSLRAFNKDLASDRGCGFQADQLCELIFRKLVPLDQASELMEVLDFLNTRVYSRLPGSYEEVIRKLEVIQSSACTVAMCMKADVARSHASCANACRYPYCGLT